MTGPPRARYSSSRRAAVAPVLRSSVFVGWLETLGGDFGGGAAGAAIRDAAIFTAGRLGVAEAIFVNGAAPRV